MNKVGYRVATRYKSWALIPRWLNWQFSIDFGIWFRKTSDYLIPIENAPATVNFHFPLIEDPSRQIRLLCLEPGSWDAPLRGCLKIVDLNEAIAGSGFEALSYSWGRDTSSEQVDLGDGHISIMPNAASALRQIRQESKVRSIWIDSICINQNDNSEKMEQVQLMGDIYAAAKQVLVWLGPSTQHSHVGMAVLRDFLRAKPFGDTEAWRSIPQGMVREGLLDIMQRRWWSRHWVAQEVALANDVVLMCGDNEIRWSNRCTVIVQFMRSIKLALVSPQWEALGFADIDLERLLSLLQITLTGGPQRKFWLQRRERDDFLEMVFTMRHQSSTDRRDRIFSLLGLAPHVVKLDLIPSYVLHAEDSFDEFAQAVQIETRRLCAELSMLESHGDPPLEDTALRTPPDDTPAEDQSLDMNMLIQRVCDGAKQATQNGDHARAAKLLSDTAILLQGASGLHS